MGVGRRGSLRAMEQRAATGVQRAKWRDSHTEDWCQPALNSLRGLPAHLLGWVGAEAWALEVRSQGENWSWLCEHSLRGLVCHS